MRANVLEKGIHDFLSGDINRPLGERWRKDGEPSKHDKCCHGLYMWEECDACACDHFEDVLLKAATKES